jgi:ATP-dependent RNA helicase DDX51/DBP6
MSEEGDDGARSASPAAPAETTAPRIPSGLEAFPHPPRERTPRTRPTFATLPPWLAQPDVVPRAKQEPLASFPISPRLLAALQKKGIADAFAIQAAVLPLLLPGRAQYDGDVCISAATGSGKSLAYMIPLTESLRGRAVTRLRGLVVVPTRELVRQAREVCDLCCAGSDLKVQSAVGSRPLKAEQDDLVGICQRYDPGLAERCRRNAGLYVDGCDYNPAMDDVVLPNGKAALLGHTIIYESKVDILICTPGRLVDHIRSTPGFTVEDLEWLVIDEADKLLDQSFQGWISVVQDRLRREKSFDDLTMDHKIGRRIGAWRHQRVVRKVMLSATMTRDLSKLNNLKLRKPKLVMMEDIESPEHNESQGDTANVQDSVETNYELPPTLKETVIPAGEGGEKPLYLHHLLESIVLNAREGDSSAIRSSSLSSTSSSSEALSGPESASSDAQSESSLSSGAGSDSSPDESLDTRPRSRTSAPRSAVAGSAQARNIRGALIFTKSNEAAMRLTRLLTLLHPPYAELVGTLTSTQPSAQRKTTLRAFNAARLSILVASNLVARGIDIPRLAHVVNYDVPASVRDYVHRVGRTARAGQPGQAWTLLADKEARWFWNAIARGPEVRRARDSRVVKRRIDLSSSGGEAQKAYVDALKALSDEVHQTGR